MPGKVISLARRRRTKSRGPESGKGRVPIALQASAGTVTLTVGSDEDGASVSLPSGAALELGFDVIRFAFVSLTAKH